ncbi:MAG: gamma-glutamylcyclotransferase family protein [Pseudomonadota bacterium]
MTPYFFGYGSLVNAATHDYPDPRPARLRGWRRVWVQTPARKAVYLSVEPHAGTTIKGLIAAVPGADWAALDLREAAYDRLPSGGAIQHDLSPPPQVSHYAVKNPQPLDLAEAFIVLSYLDIVIKGYLDVFGTDGVQRFFDTTVGWDTPILNDRSDPRYPRYHQLTRAEEALVDDHLAALLK